MSDTTLARLRFHANICRMLVAILLILGVVDIAIYSSSSCKQCHKGDEAHDCHSSNQIARAFRPVLLFHLLPVLPALVLVAQHRLRLSACASEAAPDSRSNADFESDCVGVVYAIFGLAIELSAMPPAFVEYHLLIGEGSNAHCLHGQSAWFQFWCAVALMLWVGVFGLVVLAVALIMVFILMMFVIFVCKEIGTLFQELVLHDPERKAELKLETQSEASGTTDV